MKRKINKMLLLIASIAILFTVLLITIVYYDLFQKQIFEDLRAYTMLVKEYKDVDKIKQLGEKLYDYGMRMTLVDKEGNVLFDSEADFGQMENHSTRPEIIQAFQTGEGKAARHSKTMSEDTFYYAVQLSEGEVLRIARDANNIYSIFDSTLPSLIVVLVILMLLSMFVAHHLTIKLVAPIEKLVANIDEEQEKSEYEELTPFINTIKQQHRDILKSAKMRQEFTANVSHELKTPLTSICGYAELIETGMASEADMIRFGKGIHKSANRLLILINDIIRLSELDGTEKEVSFEIINLYELAETCVEMLTMNAEKHHVTISLYGSECHINANKQMMEEVLYNLCDNAIRYNNTDGKVEVGVYPYNGKVILEVKDTGIGIPKEHQERVFERFYRVDKSRSKSTGGTGLGLAIVKHIIAIHKAEMQLESEVGKGTHIKVLFS